VLQALAAAAEPELAELLAKVDRNRLDGMRAFIAALEGHGPLRIESDAAAQTTWALASPELHQLLVQRGGWSQERYRDWLADTLAAALLP
jgi:hypothetical protein